MWWQCFGGATISMKGTYDHASERSVEQRLQSLAHGSAGQWRGRDVAMCRSCWFSPAPRIRDWYCTASPFDLRHAGCGLQTFLAVRGPLRPRHPNPAAWRRHQFRASPVHAGPRDHHDPGPGFSAEAIVKVGLAVAQGIHHDAERNDDQRDHSAPARGRGRREPGGRTSSCRTRALEAPRWSASFTYGTAAGNRPRRRSRQNPRRPRCRPWRRRTGSVFRSFPRKRESRKPRRLVAAAGDE